MLKREPDDLTTEEMIVVHWKRTVLPKIDICGCGNLLGEGGVCPSSQKDLDGDGELCNCCDSCRSGCV